MILAAALGSRRRSGVPYPLPTARPYNAPYPAITPTYDGSGEAVHPSVVDMRRYGGGRWNGWRYWMAMTPFPGGVAELENPSILVSNNGYEWSVPPGLTNPVYPKVGSFNSDTHLIYDPPLDRLVMIHRNTPTGGAPSKVLLSTSPDGITWPETLIDLELSPATHPSPSLMRVGTEWHIYGLAAAGTPGTIMRWTSPDLETWSTGEAITGPAGINIWHLAVQYFDGQFWMLMDRGPGHLTGRPDGYRAATSLDGLTWAVAPDDLMVPIGLNYETFQHYRADFQPHEDGVHMRLWYSHEARTPGATSGVWGTSFTQVRRDEWPAPPTP